MMSSQITVLALVTALLSGVAHLVAGPYAVSPVGVNQISVQIGLLLVFFAAVAIVMLADSVRLAHRFASGPGKQVDFRALVGALDKPGIESVLIVLIAAYGIGATASLAEVYRFESAVWNDEWLWENERSLFSFLLALPVNLPRVWDAIYQILWLVLFLGLAGLARSGRTKLMAEALCAVVIAFHLTRYAAISFPSAGPIFYRAELFDLSGTGSATFVPLLRDYMAGRVDQNGFFPGSQAFPSLHVGLAWCAVVVMARGWRWTLWVTVPWFVLNWLSTLFLGWHYAVDGVGGIAVMSLALLVSGGLMRAASQRSSSPIQASRQGVSTCRIESVSREGGTMS